MRHSSAPESMMPQQRVSRPQVRETGNRPFGFDGGEVMSARLTRTPPSSEPGLLVERGRHG